MRVADRGPNQPRVRVVAARIEREGRYLLAQRRAEAVLPLLWEFPGGRVEEGERDEDALQRELAEKLGLPVEVGPCQMRVSHPYRDYTLDLLVYEARALGEPQALGVAQVRWVAPEEFSAYEFPGADQQTVDALLGRA